MRTGFRTGVQFPSAPPWLPITHIMGIGTPSAQAEGVPYIVFPQQPPNSKSGIQNNKIHNGRKNIAVRRSMFIAITDRSIEASVVFFSLVYSKPRPNLRLARLNLRSTSIRSVLSLYSVFLSVSSCFGLPSFSPKS